MENKKLMWGVIFAVTILLSVFVMKGYNQFPLSGAITSDASSIKEIRINAFQFDYNPNTVTVNKGEKIRLKINNIDVPHGIRIPDLNIQGENSVEFIADKTGEFAWYCFIPCGKGHWQMKGKLTVK